MGIEAKRGLNFKTTPLALKARASKQALDLFSDLGIMNHIEWKHVTRIRRVH
jgi:glutamine synthetase